MITVQTVDNATDSVPAVPLPRTVVRQACLDDAGAIARIHNQAILARTSTFETEPRTPAAIEALLMERGTTYPTIVVERAGRVLGWAGSSPHSTRACFARIAEFSVYVDRDVRGRGVGRAALEALVAECELRGFWKLLSRVFPENIASRMLCRSLGFREVGVLHCHAPVDGTWRDAVIVERLLGEARRAGGHTVHGQAGAIEVDTAARRARGTFGQAATH